MRKKVGPMLMPAINPKEIDENMLDKFSILLFTNLLQSYSS